MTNWKRISIGFGVYSSVVAISLVYLGVIKRRFWNTGRETEGIVTYVYVGVHGGVHGIPQEVAVDEALVSFSVAGRRYQVKVPGPGSGSSLEVGQGIEVTFDPTDPRRAELSLNRPTGYLKEIAVGALLLGLYGIGAFVYLVAVKASAGVSDDSY